MQNYKRNVTYFYQYQNGVVGATAGFLKMEIRGDKVKITINIQEASHRYSANPALYFYHETGDYLTAVKVGEVERIDGVLTFQTRTPWQELFDTGRDLYTFDGVLVLYSDNDYYLGDFQGRDRKSYDVRLVSKDSNKEKAAGKDSGDAEENTKLDEYNMESGGIDYEDFESDMTDFETAENGSSEDYRDEGVVETGETDKDSNIECEEKESVSIKESKAENDYDIGDKNYDIDKNYAENIDDMLKYYPKLPMYGSVGLTDCVRIQPKDIGKLDIGNWKLGSNSFLSHGFYIYKYLLLGKMRFEDGIYHMVLGVPGVYSNRERYMANMFGFDQFVPVKNNGMRTGEFGYWIVEVRE